MEIDHRVSAGMTFSGLLTLNVTGDAGAGRKLWLAERLKPDDRVVDLGGTGELLAGWHEHVTALDDLSGFGPGHRIQAKTFIRGDVGQRLPFEDDAFDVAVLTEVLEHVPRPWEAMREAGRVAKRVLITTPFEQRWQHPIAFKVSGHIRFFTPDIFCLHLRRAGLDGEAAVLEFGGWSFLVADVRRLNGHA